MVDECPLCESKTTKRKVEVKDYSFSGELFNVFECKECHVGFTEPKLSKEKLETYYSKEKYHSYQKKKGLFSLIYKFI